MTLPDNNPKTARGELKTPLHLVPPSSMYFLARAFADGASKYGPYNWRKEMISSSTYYGAALRHLTAWWDGEDCAKDSGEHHLAHAMACIALILDSSTISKLNDNRPHKGVMGELLDAAAKHSETPKPADPEPKRISASQADLLMKAGIDPNEIEDD
jgi:hypothetical protein